MKARELLFVGLLIFSGLGGYSEIFGAVDSEMTKTVSGGGVTAKVTYLNPNRNDEPRFQVVFDTHSVNLDAYDLRSIAILRDDAGKSYVPTAVENKGGGHHREAIVSYPKLSPQANHVELVIKDLAGVKERSFAWNLE